MNTGDKLKDLRIKSNLSMDSLIEKLNKKYDLNITKSMMSRWENNLSEPSNKFVAAYAKFFNIDLNYLVGLTDIKSPLYNENTDTYKSERDLMIEKYQLNPEELAEYDRIMKLSIEMNTLMFQSNNIELEVADKEEMDYELSETLKKAFISSLITKREKEKKE
jgi:putative prophage lambdaCh01, repressor protein|nr:MAG TPA: helix-turn-helix domain protein [Caudoviricetes sp.]